MKPVIKMGAPIQASLLAWSVWIVAILINAVVVMCWMGSFERNELSFEMTGFIICFSAMFSSPGFLLLWLTCLFNVKKKRLFRILLLTSLIAAATASVIVAVMIGELSQFTTIIYLSPVASAVLSVVAHTPFINKIIEKYNDEPCIETL